MPNAFKHRFWKYVAAMKACPTSRFAELVPLLSLKSGSNVFYDLMGGDGFASEHMGVKFDKSFLIDQCTTAFPGYDRTRIEYINADTTHLDFQALALPQANTMVCLAGFHHLPWDSNNHSLEAVDSFRSHVLHSWRNGLQVGGRLIVADVAGIDACSSAGPLSDQRCGNVLSRVAPLTGVDMFCPKVEPEPAEFLNVFVHQESAGGHNCQFETTTSLREKLKAAGYCNVDSTVYYTPWVFPDKLTAIMFVADLFAIGSDPAVSQQGELLPVGIKTEEAINKYLGMTSLEDGRCVIHWKLLYAWGDRCDD